jgi:predicted TIM-barrel fold metal-dependent hydrolase
MVNELLESYLAGERLPFPVCDCHSHSGLYFHFPIMDGDTDGILRGLDTAGVDGTIVTSLESMVGDPRPGNRGVLEMVRRHPDRFLGYVTLNPHYREETKEDLETYADAPEFVGAKVHQSVSACPANDPAWDPVYQTANDRGWLLLSHVWGVEEVKRHYKTVERFPNLKLLLGHAGGDHDGYAAAIELAKKSANVFLDPTNSQMRAGLYEWLVDEVGPERVLFGTDIPFLDARGAAAWVLGADIDDHAKELILGGNLLRLLGDRAKNWIQNG